MERIRALHDPSALPRIAPSGEGLIKARGWAYESLNDHLRAGQDYRTAIALDGGDAWPLLELGNLYLHVDHAWDKAWSVADRLVQTCPAQPVGWLLRAEIQKDQPREGLANNADYYAAHFDTNPQAHAVLLKMRAALALQPKLPAHPDAAHAAGP